MIFNVPEQCGLESVEGLLATVRETTVENLVVAVPSRAARVHPMALCVFAAQAARVRAAGGEVLVEGDIAPGSDLHKMGLREHLFLPDRSDAPASDPTGRYIPLTQVAENKALTSFVTDFVPILHAPPQTALAFSYVLYELIRNVLEHSGSDAGAYVAADIDEDGTVRLGVSDAGIGVPKSIRRAHSARTDEDAVRLAFSPGVSGVSSKYGGNETNGGAGLFFMKSISLLSRRLLVMVTQQTLMRLDVVPPEVPVEITASLDDDAVTWSTLGWSLAGTAVGIDLEVGDGRDYEDLFAEIRSAYHVNVGARAKSQKRARFT